MLSTWIPHSGKISGMQRNCPSPRGRYGVTSVNTPEEKCPSGGGGPALDWHVASQRNPALLSNSAQGFTIHE